MPALHQQSTAESLASNDSAMNSPPIYGESPPTGNSMRSISELLGLHMPRGTTLGQTSNNSLWSPSAVSSPQPQPALRNYGVRPPSFPPFSSLDSGFSSLDTPTSWYNSAGFDLTQPFSPVSPLCGPTPRAIRGCSPYSDCSSPLMEPAPVVHRASRSISPSDSDASSNDLCDGVNSLSLSQGGVCSPPTEQELANLRALHTLTSNPNLNSFVPGPAAQQALFDNRPWPVNENADLLDKVAKFHRTQGASIFEPGACTWSGVLPQRFMENPTLSCKVFLGGVPWDVTEETLVCVFSQFGKVRIEWPGKEHPPSQPKGYVYIIFETEKQVKALLNNCTRDVNGNSENFYFRISSRKMKSKEVQVIPWALANSNYVQVPSQKLDPHTTVFVGALHGMLTAEGLFKIMNDLFGGVVYAGIDTDKFKYPIGSARVTFNNQYSYLKAVMAAFIEIKTTKFTKKLQVDPYLEDSPCSNCKFQQGAYFCRELTCFRYFCLSCWELQHQYALHANHKPMNRSSKNTNRQPPQMRFSHQ